MSGMIRRYRQAVDWKEIQECKSQKDRNGGVHTHHDLRGAERQSIFYVKATAGTRVSNQVDSVYSSINTASGYLANGYFLQGRPGCEIVWRLNAILDKGVDEGTGIDGREWLVNACGSLLIGKFDDIGWPGIELTAVAGGLVFVSPGHGVLPYLRCAPRVIAHYDDGGRIPLIVVFEQIANVGEIAICKSQVVDVRGVFVAEGLFSAVVEAVGMWDGQMQEEKVDG